MRDQPRQLLASVEGLRLVEIARPTSAAASAEPFAVKYRRISNAIVAKKADRHRGDRRRIVLAGDLGCLMNMAGKLQREGRPIKARHVAEVLAGMTDEPAIGAQPPDCRRKSPEVAMTRRRAPRRDSAPMPRRRWPTPTCRSALTLVERISSAGGARSPTGCRNSRRLRDSARAIKDHTLAHLDLYLEA